MRFLTLILAFSFAAINAPAQVLNYENYTVSVYPIEDSLFNVVVTDLSPKGKFVPAFSGSRFDSLNARALEVLLYELADQQAKEQAEAEYEQISKEISGKRMQDGLAALGATRFTTYLTVNQGKKLAGSYDILSDSKDSLRVNITEQLEFKDAGGRTVGVMELTSSRGGVLTPIGSGLKQVVGPDEVAFYMSPAGELTAWVKQDRKLVILRRIKK